ncbi:HD domain-containing protein [Clostridium sp.]|jgi:poly(A) polymerase|uniref:HD domain-containing protein n=1 Tax=Clostridium sp. TaxID=1506 RepID=UPI002587F85A|nr:HD domain-containing protein [Clostridium sp.]MDF2503925.1 tRNA nucleotidyltransferase/poly(A) polymerase [Clostridium sp.]
MIKIIGQLKEVILYVGGDIYLVDNYVREKLIKPTNVPKELDIIYSRSIKNIYNAFNKKFNYTIQLYNEEKVLIIKDKDFVMKISQLAYDNIEKYLENADYTMNAVALKLIDNKIIDPFQGRLHIEKRIIQEVNDKSIENNPLSILKGIGYYINYGMHFSINTELHIKEQSIKLQYEDGGDVLKELMHIISIDKNGVAFHILDQYSILQNLLPYIKELKTIGKCKYHVEDTFTHMNDAYEILKEIQYGRVNLDGLNRDIFKKRIGGYKLIDILAFAVFVHDIGKFETYKKKAGKVSFIGHDIVGEKIMREVCKKLNIPKKMEDLICTVIKAHMYPLKLFKIKSNQDEFNKELDKFFIDYKEYSEYIFIASYCDILSTTMYYDSENQGEEYKLFIERFLKMQ